MDEPKLLITGGAGFVGSNLVQCILNITDFDVLNIDKLTYAGRKPSGLQLGNDGRHLFFQVDVCDRQRVQKLLAEFQPAAIIHCAAESHVDRSIDSPAEFIQTNIVGTFSMLEAAREFHDSLDPKTADRFRFLHVSTDEVYGDVPENTRSTESDPLRPNSPYSASKAASDHLVRSYHRTYGLPTITTNASNNYGPYQFPEKLIPKVIQNALLGKSIPIYGDGQQVRDWIHVTDHCRALIQLCRDGSPGEVYNIGADCLSNNLELAQTLCDLVDEIAGSRPSGPRRDLIRLTHDRLGHDRRYALDTKKIKAAIDWRPIMDFRDGLTQTVAWYLHNPDWPNGG